MKNYNSKFLQILNLDSTKQYSKKTIFNKMIGKKSFYSKIKNKDLWILDNKIINLLIDDIYHDKVNKSFYKLFYHEKNEWRRCLKYGFNKIQLLEIIDSLCINNFTKIYFNQKGLNVKIINI